MPGLSLTYGVLNFTLFQLTEKNFLTLRNEWIKDEHGTRYGFPGNYTSNSVGLTHNFTPYLQIRPEFGFYRNHNTPAFDNGRKKEMYMFGVDMTWRF